MMTEKETCELLGLIYMPQKSDNRKSILSQSSHSNSNSQTDSDLSEDIDINSADDSEGDFDDAMVEECVDMEKKTPSIE